MSKKREIVTAIYEVDAAVEHLRCARAIVAENLAHPRAYDTAHDIIHAIKDCHAALHLLGSPAHQR